MKGPSVKHKSRKVAAGPVAFCIGMAFIGTAFGFKKDNLLDKTIRDITAPLAGLGVEIDSGNTTLVKPLQKASARPVTDYASRVTTGTWNETRSGQTVRVSEKLWSRAIQAALDENKIVRIPDQGRPYYIESPLVLHSGNRLIVDPKVEIRLKPDTNTCMVRNEHQVTGQNGPVHLNDKPDVDIIIEGGIWTTLAIGSESNGNVNGGPDPANAFHGHGTILLNHARRVQVRNLTIKECRPHGIQLSNVSEFVIENINFIDHGRDGVHMNGPVSFGLIRNIQGKTFDDFIAVNAWDWKNTAPTFGPIHHLLIEKVRAETNDVEIRFLGGTKHFSDGKTLDCDIHDCVIRDVSGVKTFKMYDQPNLELGRDNDFADPIGNVRNLYVSEVTINNPPEPPFQIAMNVNGLTLDHISMIFDKPGKTCNLIHLGPMSATFKHDPNNPATWVEIFSPDKDCTLRNLNLSNISKSQLVNEKTVTSSLGESDCLEIVTQKPNPDYPKTTPKGGTGKGILIK